MLRVSILEPCLPHNPMQMFRPGQQHMVKPEHHLQVSQGSKPEGCSFFTSSANPKEPAIQAHSSSHMLQCLCTWAWYPVCITDRKFSSRTKHLRSLHPLLRHHFIRSSSLHKAHQIALHLPIDLPNLLNQSRRNTRVNSSVDKTNNRGIKLVNRAMLMKSLGPGNMVDTSGSRSRRLSNQCCFYGFQETSS